MVHPPSMALLTLAVLTDPDECFNLNSLVDDLMLTSFDFECAGFNFAGPVGDAGFPEAQMPFADVRCAVALLLQKARKRQHVHIDGQRAVFVRALRIVNRSGLL